MQHKPDSQLIEEIKEGDILAFEELVRRYQNRLFYFCLRMLSDEKEAEETVQDTFFKIYKNISKVDVNRKFSTYIFSIAKYTAISKLRKRKNETSLDENMTDGSTYDQYWEQAELKEKITTALDTLDRKYRSVVTLYYFDELSYKEIGEKLNLPVNTVRTHLKRAKEQLKQILEK